MKRHLIAGCLVALIVWVERPIRSPLTLGSSDSVGWLSSLGACGASSTLRYAPNGAQWSAWVASWPSSWVRAYGWSEVCPHQNPETEDLTEDLGQFRKRGAASHHFDPALVGHPERSRRIYSIHHNHHKLFEITPTESFSYYHLLTISAEIPAPPLKL